MILQGNIDLDIMEAVATKIVQSLIERKETIATMESCTGGLLVSEITNISGASEVLKESYVTYCNQAKIRLGVSKEIIEKFSVYSEETAIEMAKNVSNRAKANLGVGITGQLGRIDPNNPGANNNEVFYALSYNGEIKDVCHFVLTRECKRLEKKQMVVQEILKRIQEQCMCKREQADVCIT